jgi:hypothetical protein
VIAFLDTLGGIASHPLLVHIPVVLIPVAAIGVIAIAIRPSWMRHYGPLVAGVAFVGFLGSVLAASTGEALEEEFEDAGQTISGTLADHIEMGDRVKIFAFLFLLATLAWVVVARRRRTSGSSADTSADGTPAAAGRGRHAVTALMVLALVTGGVATWSVTTTGHSGATSVWEQPEP